MKTAIAAFLFLSFFPFPASSIVEGTSETVCLGCHFGLPFEGSRLAFNEGIGKICSGCHRNYHGSHMKYSHPDSIIPSMTVPRDMPLDVKGALSCVTCHTFHVGHDSREGAYEFLLRRSRGKALCYSCHKRRLF